MKAEWTVTVVVRRGSLSLRARSRQTGKILEQQAEAADRRKADKEAGAWERDLNSGKVAASRLTFVKAWKRYEDENLESRRASTFERARTARNAFVKLVGGDIQLSNITTARISEFSRKLKTDRKLADAGVAVVLRHIKAFIRWAHRLELIERLPHFEMPKVEAKAKGRAITGEEFDRLLLVVDKVRKNDPDTWTFLLKGLWETGLRLQEGMSLSWDRDEAICLDLDARELRIEAASQKGNRVSVIPITPEAAALFQTIPTNQREGLVFKIKSRCRQRVGKVIAKMGEKSAIVTGKDNVGETRHCTAHDLRRGFAVRMARKLLPQQLMLIMRHKSISTTLAYYTGLDSKGVADALWAGQTNRLSDRTGDKLEKSLELPIVESTQTLTQ